MLTQLAVSDIIRNQRNFFKPVKQNVAFRLEQLRTLKQAVVEAQSTVIKALKADLNKPEFEAYAAEVNKEIDYAIKHIKSWTSPKKAIPLSISGNGCIYAEPLSSCPRHWPWNYPFHLITRR